MSTLPRLESNSGTQPIEDHSPETSSHTETSHSQAPEQSAGPSANSDSEVREFLEDQAPASPASEYSQDFELLPNPHSPRNSGDFGPLPDPRPLPGPNQAFVEGHNLLATPASDGLRQQIAAAQFEASNNTLMSMSASAVQRNRKKNQPIENTPSTQQFRAGEHPSLSRKQRGEFRREATRGKAEMQAKTPGSTIGRIREEKRERERAAAEAEKKKKEEQFGLTDADFKRMFAPD